MDLNEKIIIEFIVLISGPIFQFIGYIILVFLFKDIELINMYHYGILLFNLLPIYPLDGGKLINLILNEFISYKKSLYIVIYISYIMLLVILIVQRNIKLNVIILVLLLSIMILKEHRKIKQKYNKFLLERYLNDYKFNKSKIINNDNNLYRDNNHIIKINNNYYLEKDLLKKKYEKKR